MHKLFAREQKRSFSLHVNIIFQETIRWKTVKIQYFKQITFFIKEVSTVLNIRTSLQNVCVWLTKEKHKVCSNLLQKKLQQINEWHNIFKLLFGHTQKLFIYTFANQQKFKLFILYWYFIKKYAFKFDYLNCFKLY